MVTKTAKKPGELPEGQAIVTVAQDCKVAAFGCHVYNLSVGENIVPEDHAEDLSNKIKANGYDKPLKKSGQAE